MTMKKDIFYQSVTENNEPKMSVDEIFANADSIMENMQQETYVKANKKKRKIGFVKKTIISLIIVAVILVVLLIVIGVKSLSAAIPSMKEAIFEQFSTTRESLLKINDDNLTVDEYYQKQVFLLISPEDAENTINNLSVWELFSSMMSGTGTIDIDLIPEDKKEEYEQIIKEYEKAKAEELEQTEVTERAVETQNNDTESEIISTE
jgi:small basic protein